MYWRYWQIMWHTGDTTLLYQYYIGHWTLSIAWHTYEIHSISEVGSTLTFRWFVASILANFLF